MKFSWKNYDPNGFYDELIGSRGRPRAAGRVVARQMRSLTPDQIRERQEAAELAVKTMGVTFTVHAEGANLDRAWPYDIIPRTISGREWDRVEAGLVQRLTALNLFIDDVYNEQKVFTDAVVPRELIVDSPNFREARHSGAACHGTTESIKTTVSTLSATVISAELPSRSPLRACGDPAAEIRATT